MRIALFICIIAATLVSCTTTNKDHHRPELEFVVAEDPDQPGQKCILGTYRGCAKIPQHFTEKIVPEFENDLKVGTLVRAVISNCEGCTSEVWSSTLTDGSEWHPRIVPYKIIARQFPDDSEA